MTETFADVLAAREHAEKMSDRLWIAHLKQENPTPTLVGWDTDLSLAIDCLNKAYAVLNELGLKPQYDGEDIRRLYVRYNPFSYHPSLVEIADATADICVVTKGSQAAFGLAEEYPEELPDMKMVKQFMEAMGQTVREESVFSSDTVPPLTEKERLLRGGLIFEETLELIMQGFGLEVEEDHSQAGSIPYAKHNLKQFSVAEVRPLSEQEFDETRLARALNEVNLYARVVDVVHAIPSEDVILNEVMRSNMAKLWDDGKPRYRESDGKAIKPPNWKGHDIPAALKRAGWDEEDTALWPRTKKRSQG